MKISFLILCIIFGWQPCWGNFVKIKGLDHISQQTSYFEQEYKRIWKTINPSQVPDTTPIWVEFYHKGSSKKGIRLPEWGGGGAIGKDTIIMPINQTPFLKMDYRQTLVHELVHIALSRSYGYIHLPRFFHEGLAMLFSGELSFDATMVVGQAIFSHTILSLDSIEKVNFFSREKAQLAYAQSHLAIEFLVRKYGLEGISELLTAVRQNRSFSTAFLKVYGLTMTEFESMYNQALTEKYWILFFASDTYLFWIGITMLFILGYIVTKIRNRKKLANLDDDIEGEQSENEDTENSELKAP